MKRIVSVSAGIAAATGLPVAADAETTKSFQVSAAIVAGCLVTTDAQGRWGTIDLGTVSGVDQGDVAADLMSAGGVGIAISCTPGLTASVSADQGDHAAGGTRRLARSGGAAVPIAYRLLVNGGATVWAGQSLPLSFAGGVSQLTLPVRGVATLARPMAAGAYTDTVRITVAW